LNVNGRGSFYGFRRRVPASDPCGVPLGFGLFPLVFCFLVTFDGGVQLVLKLRNPRGLLVDEVGGSAEQWRQQKTVLDGHMIDAAKGFRQFVPVHHSPSGNGGNAIQCVGLFSPSMS
jgi:hypothetical protein